MAAAVEVDESNDASGEVVTHNPANGNYGAIDSPALNPTANPLVPGNNSYEKWSRWHVTAMGGAVVVRTLRFFSTTPAANTSEHFNGHTNQTTYNSANHKQTAFSAPATSATRTPETVPTVAPSTANIGIGGSLTGELLAPGSSDYLVSQLRTTSPAVAGSVLTQSFRYEEVA